MANTVSSSVVYVDATGTISDTENVRLMGVIVTSSAAAGQLILKDQTSGDLKLDVKVKDADDTKQLRFPLAPITFTNGIEVDTVTNVVATLIVRRQGITGGA
jgi:hypothetical protein